MLQQYSFINREEAMTEENSAESVAAEPVANQAADMLETEDQPAMKRSDALGNEISHCTFYLHMPENVFAATMAAPLTTHDKIMARATNNGRDGKLAVAQRAVRLMNEYIEACQKDDPHTAQARVDKKLKELSPFIRVGQPPSP
jgi:hypothetical protein